MRNLENDYNSEMMLEAAYDEAKKSNNQAGIDAVRKSYQLLVDAVQAEGKDYGMVLRMFVRSKKLENSCIDVNNDTYYDSIESLVAAFRKYGVSSFTYSGSSTRAMEDLWSLKTCGAKMQGMVQSNIREACTYGDPNAEKYKKGPGFLFTLN